MLVFRCLAIGSVPLLLLADATLVTVDNANTEAIVSFDFPLISASLQFVVGETPSAITFDHGWNPSPKTRLQSPKTRLQSITRVILHTPNKSGYNSPRNERDDECGNSQKETIHGGPSNGFETNHHCSALWRDREAKNSVI